MIGIALLHAFILLLGIGIASRVVATRLVSGMIGYLHKTIGITTPAPEQVRMVALIWLGSVVVIVDGCLFLLLFIARLSRPG